MEGIWVFLGLPLLCFRGFVMCFVDSESMDEWKIFVFLLDFPFYLFASMSIFKGYFNLWLCNGSNKIEFG